MINHEGRISDIMGIAMYRDWLKKLDQILIWIGDYNLLIYDILKSMLAISITKP